ncbi:LysR family transcriptional regulator [Caballeronia sordidicola]|uniref:Chromosome initiation inhibitor n=1 Tax=Caballeronia sordidicola TaxID=196367 RepID=A0A242MXE7_CABSO|nr:LysR family transcriptional regulator [Caballeronia sordidicola]OTP76111.1 Chromosome initiation inhibitor [Caballeronia sordidicola]
MGLISSLTLDQLRVLVTIGDEGSFSAAGRSLGRVQSAISQAVKNSKKPKASCCSIEPGNDRR